MSDGVISIITHSSKDPNMKFNSTRRLIDRHFIHFYQAIIHLSILILSTCSLITVIVIFYPNGWGCGVAPKYHRPFIFLIRFLFLATNNTKDATHSERIAYGNSNRTNEMKWHDMKWHDMTNMESNGNTSMNAVWTLWINRSRKCVWIKPKRWINDGWFVSSTLSSSTFILFD